MEAILGIEIIKIVFLCSFLLINTYYDIKYRQIFGTTKINCIIGIFAFSIIVYGYLENPNLDFFYIALPFVIVVPLLVLKRIPTGDSFIILITCLILPSTITVPLFGAGIIVFAVCSSFIYFISHNVILNFITLYHDRLLFRSENISIPKKITFFFLTHEKRKWEKYVEKISTRKNSELMKPRTSLNLCKTNGVIETWA